MRRERRPELLRIIEEPRRVAGKYEKIGASGAFCGVLRDGFVENDDVFAKWSWFVVTNSTNRA